MKAARNRSAFNHDETDKRSTGMQQSGPRRPEHKDSRQRKGVKMITVEVPEDEWREFQEFLRSRDAQKMFSDFGRSG